MSLVSGPQYGVPYELKGPDGSIAVFNDDTSPYYSGILIPDECSGLDSAEGRDNAVDRTEMDGMVQGDQFYSKRAVVLTGVMPATSTTARNEMEARIKRASNAMRADATLVWTPDGGEAMFTNLRRASGRGLQISGGWLKKFQLSFTAADPRLYSTALYTSSVTPAPAIEAGRGYDKVYDYAYGAATPTGTLFLTNQGDGESPPVMRIYGPGKNPSLINNTTGQSLNFIFTLNSNEEYLEIDFFSRTVKLNGEVNRYSALQFSTSEWWYLQPDQNEVRIGYSEFSAGAKLQVFYRDAWI